MANALSRTEYTETTPLHGAPVDSDHVGCPGLGRLVARIKQAFSNVFSRSAPAADTGATRSISAGFWSQVVARITNLFSKTAPSSASHRDEEVASSTVSQEESLSESKTALRSASHRDEEVASSTVPQESLSERHPERPASHAPDLSQRESDLFSARESSEDLESSFRSCEEGSLIEPHPESPAPSAHLLKRDPAFENSRYIIQMWRAREGTSSREEKDQWMKDLMFSASMLHYEACDERKKQRCTHDV